MPFKPIASVPPPPETSFLDKLRGLPGVLSALTRGVGGLAASEGGWIGGGIAGGSELAAQGIDSINNYISGKPDWNEFSLPRAGVEAGIGMIPAAAGIKGGKALLSAGLGGLLSGGGEALREAARGEHLSGSTIAGHAGIGAATGGLLGHFLSPAAVKPEIAEDLIDLGGGKTRVIRTPTTSAPPPVVEGEILPPRTRQSTPVPYTMEDVQAAQSKGMTPTTPPPPTGAMEGEVLPPSQGYPTPYGEEVPFQRRAGGMSDADALEQSNIMSQGEKQSGLGKLLNTKAAKDAERLKMEQAREHARLTDQHLKAETEATNASRIQNNIEEGGLQPGEPSIRESIKGGGKSQTIKYAAPDEEKAAGNNGELKKALGLGGSKAPDKTPEGRVGQLFAAWLAKGADRERAWTNAQKDIEPLGFSNRGQSLTPSETVGGQPSLKGPRTPVIDPAEALRNTEGNFSPPAAQSPIVETPPIQAEPATPPTPYVHGVSPNPYDTAPVPPEFTRWGQEAARVLKGEPTPPPIVPEPPPTATVPEAPTAAPEAEAPLAQLMNFFKTRVDASGMNNRAIKAAKAAGEAVPEEGRRAAGMALQREAAEAGLPTGRAAKDLAKGTLGPQNGPSTPISDARYEELKKTFGGRGPVEPPAPAATNQTPTDFTPDEYASTLAELEALQKAKAAGGPNQSLEQSVIDQINGPEVTKAGLPDRSGERGAADPALLARFLTGGLGAAAGYTFDPLGNRPASAAAGGAAGFAVPSLPGALARMGANPEAMANLSEKTASPGGLSEAAQGLWKALPGLQRASLLGSTRGLPANAMVGPWLGANMGALEEGLSGNPAGYEAMKKLRSPITFLKGMGQANDEAQRLLNEGDLGRSEGGAGGGYLSEKAREIAELPARMMSQGDVAARNLLEEGGLGDQARKITLTNEPELPFFKGIANLWKDSTLGGLVLPFKRTTANVGEQGSYRLPGIGFIANKARENAGFDPTPMRQQLVQQGLGTASMGAGYLAGDNLDPETAKGARPFITNAGGMYSLPVGIGLAAGMAHRAGKPIGPAAVAEGVSNLSPVPSFQPLTDVGTALFGNAKGEHPFPKTLIPKFIPELSGLLGLTSTETGLPQGPKLPRLGKKP